MPVLTRTQWMLTIVAIAVAALLPLFVKNFILFQLTLAMVYGIAILGLNLLTGINGQFSLGHSAFFAIGAYTAAIMMDRFGLNYLWTLPVAGIVCLGFGFLFGLPALRLHGIYLALATFSLAVATPQILKSTPLEHWTGGVQGIVIIKPDAPFGAVIGGFSVGVIENLAGTYIPYVGRELKLTIALALIVAVLTVRPSGLFGRVVVTRV